MIFCSAPPPGAPMAGPISTSESLAGACVVQMRIFLPKSAALYE
jgi:hypothetical protein